MKLTKKLHKDQRGLTLIELLAVIVILAIIAAIAIPSVNSIIKNSEARAQVENAKLIISTARMAIADRTFEQIGVDNEHSDYEAPEEEDQLPRFNTDLYNKRTIRQVTLKELKDRGYLDANLIDPQTRDAYNEDRSHVTIIMDEKTGTPGEYSVQWYYLITLRPKDFGTTGSTAKAYYEFVLESELSKPSAKNPPQNQTP